MGNLPSGMEQTTPSSTARPRQGSQGRLRSSRTCALWMTVVAMLVALVSAADSNSPKLAHTLFNNLPARIFYFDDTPDRRSSSGKTRFGESLAPKLAELPCLRRPAVVIYHDQIGKNVWRSSDEGKKWDIISGVPLGQAMLVIDHPYDSHIAFILTSTTTHYRTMNRGESWQSFTTALPPSLSANTLSFHATRWEWILYTGQNCQDLGGWRGRICHDEVRAPQRPMAQIPTVTFYTQDAFASAPHLLLKYTSRCIFAHDKKEYPKGVLDELVYCVAFEPPSDQSPKGTLAALLGGSRTLRESRLYSSTDFFQTDRTFVDLGIGKEARGVVGIGGVQKYLVCALKPSADSDGSGGEMVLYVTENGDQWSRALFPHGHGLKENAYTIVESTTHSILVDVNSNPLSSSGTLFTSNSNGTLFVRSLEHTNRNKMGIVDFEKLVSVEGVAIVNTVSNPQGVEAGEEKSLKTRITFDDGARWSLLKAPSTDNEGKKVKCDTSDLETCSLHLHSVTQPHNYGRVFSSTAPGLVMGVGSIGARLLPYDECDTFLSTDAGLTWRMVDDGANKYEFGDQGSIIIMVEDEEATDSLKYSFDFGRTWKEVDLGVKVRARLLTTAPDSTTLSFILLGTLTRRSKDKGDDGQRHIVIHIDFQPMDKRTCTSKDMERWYARTLGGEPDCLMGHKQWFMRRKADADCVVAKKFEDPVGVEENCPCADEDYECDYNFAPDGQECIAVGPEPIPTGSCLRENDKFLGSSGYRLIPGDTCDVARGIKKDAPVEKSCSAGQATPGLVTHQSFTFPGYVIDQAYFGDSHTILAFTDKNRVWESQNEGFSWRQASEGKHFVAMTMHAYAKDRAYLITDTRTVYYTSDRGITWNTFTAPTDPNGLGIPLLDFHPLRSDWLIWTGQQSCTDPDSTSCRIIAHYTKNNGRSWDKIDEYVRVCSWGRDKRLHIDEKIIFCESYRDKTGPQRAAYNRNNPLQLISGENFYTNRKVVFPSVVGFATFEQYMVVAELAESTRSIGLMISLNSKDFALARFPPALHLENQAYTVLESTTDSVFLHVTTHADVGSEWGTLFKSNSNGTYYSPSLEFVNRNSKGFVDFEKMIGLDGIAVVNIVSNPNEAALSGKKSLQSRITHNDGGRWKPLIPPTVDALGRSYECSTASCALHVHGYTERKDPRATYSSPSATGLMLAVGNVGQSLAAYSDSDTFLTRDGGFTWEEVRKDAHVWEFGDQGSILVLANDEDPTDHVAYTLNEGISWQEYNFGEKVRIRSIVTVPMDTSRKFILFGIKPNAPDSSVAIHLDFSSVTNVKCKLDLANPNSDDFELWSPSESRDEQCLFGKQTRYYRRIRDRNCFIGERLPQPHKIERYCPCTEQDFECEFNYKRDSNGVCQLVDGAAPLPSDSTCAWNQDFWHERTNMRRIPHSECQGGMSLDRGAAHVCPGRSTRGFFFWATLSVVPFLFAGLTALWWTRRRGGHGGRIRLPEPGDGSNSQLVDLLLSVPWAIVGIVAATASRVREMDIPFISNRLRRRDRSGYRLHIDDDAEVLMDYDEDE
ncbi:BZ3500_MvSof-1268-A1-R1_Chr6-3g08852 [Microbotryum saponariae]|uniref:Vacuolar protein sorting/targeting protein 10 n=1 Tax=Microbotryum saponariae TaxID=289078 RepID=A0A2X0MPB3_9BASI|nr:BZ3500_MvSof-1268-A1-R1_Chr6-3g08852 [Microbotryum saponariae]SDA07453.1 BZ3501_MvSof-1269-A2-R1_Chr6-2g08555 [Microbotryum saponariae]